MACSIRHVSENDRAESFSNGYDILEVDGVEIARRSWDWWGEGRKELEQMKRNREQSNRDHPLQCPCIKCRD